MPENHPDLLAFEYSWTEETDNPNKPFVESFFTVNAYDLAHFRHLAQGQSDVILLAVHHVSAEDDFTLTDLIWRKPDHDEFPCSYDDRLARESWARQD